MIFGVTGHQKLQYADLWPWVTQSFRSVVDQYQHEDSELLTCLAVGADQMLADEAISAGLRIVAVIPCMGYEKSFAVKEDLDRYRYLLHRATRHELRDFPEPSEDAYLAAGKYIVDNVKVMVAVWNGKPAAGKGGTGDIVEYAQKRKRRIVHINPVTQQVSEL